MTLQDKELCDLIARCALKDQAALRALYDDVSGYLNLVAYRIVQSEETSNEVLQEGFLQIWNYAASYRVEKSKPLTWMTSIVRYRALDRLDKDQRYTKRIIRDENNDHTNTMVDPDTPIKTLEQCALSSHIADCLKTLSSQAEQAIRYAYLQGLTREEIAEKLTTNTNTVKSWLRRGGERLKKCLSQHYEVSR